MKQYLQAGNSKMGKPYFSAFAVALFLLISIQTYSATKTSTGTGNWKTAAIWSPAGVPAAGDDVIIRSGDVITVDSIFVCNNLTIGNSTNADGTVQITSAANSLTINGDLQLNPNSKNKSFILDAGPGTINIAGTFSVWNYGSSASVSGLYIGSGTINITPAITISSSKQNITFTGAGTVTFNGAFVNQYAGLVTFAGCTVNFKSSMTVNTTASDWAGKGTAVFWNGSSITPTSAITFNNVQILASASVTLNNGAGAVSVGGSATLGSGSTLTTNKDIEVGGDWINNGGTFTGTNDTLTLNGTSGTIGGTSSSSFRVLRIGRNAGSTAVSYTMNQNVTCNYLRLSTGSVARTLTIATGKVLAVNNDVTLNQPSTDATTTVLQVGAGTCNVSGNLIFSGTSATATRIAKIDVSSGTFALTGSVTWMSNTAVETEIITVSTGTITFGSSLTMATQSGTLAVTGTGTINFNGSSAPSFTFGGAVSPVFTTTNGCTVNFAKGFTNNTNTLTLAASSQTNITGSGTITPTAGITFGHLAIPAAFTCTLATGGALQVAGNVTLGSGSTLTTNQSFQVDGNWTNNGGTFSGTAETVTFNGSSGTIGGTAPTTFRTIQIGKNSGSTSASYSMDNDNTCNYLILNGSSGGRTFSCASGKTLTVNNDVTIQQPTGVSTVTLLSVNAGTCSISGNLVFSGNAPVVSQVAQVAVTSGTFSVAGTVTWMTNTKAETEVITVSTGTVSFGSSVTMGSGSGTIAVTGTGTINFNGASVPSLLFGGAVAPVLTTTSGCHVHFEKGFSNLITSLTFVSGSNVSVGSVSSATNLTIDPGATITSNGTTIVYGDLTSTSASTFVNGDNAVLEIRGAVSNNVTLTASAAGNTVKYSGSSDQTVKPTTYYNLVAGNAGVKTLGASTAINNNLTVQDAATIATTASQTVGETFTYASSGTSTLSNNISAKGIVLTSGTLNDGGNTITVNGAGGWTNNGATFTSSGTTLFTGGIAQQIAGNTATRFSTLNITNAVGVTLNVNPAAATVVSNILVLNNGILHTSSASILRLLDGATSSNSSNTSYVDGPMVKVGDDAFDFPIGKSGRLRKAGISGLADLSTEVTAEYFFTSYTDLLPVSGDLQSVSPVEYWMIDRTVTAEPVKIKLFWANPSNVSNCENLKIAHWKGSQWEEELATVVSGSTCNYLNDGSGSIETNSGVTSFSPFTFGDGGGALPIKLLSFDAMLKEDKVYTQWVTSMEINNEYFTVERSSDGVNFTEVTNVPGAGNSTSLLSYQSVDENPLQGISYYRLKQTDFDGAFAYSELVSVNTGSISENVFRVYPNPTADELYLTVSNPKNEVRVLIYDLAGREMYAGVFPVSVTGANQTLAIETKYLLPTGMYMLSAATNGVEYREKLILR